MYILQQVEMRYEEDMMIKSNEYSLYKILKGIVIICIIDFVQLKIK